MNDGELEVNETYTPLLKLYSGMLEEVLGPSVPLRGRPVPENVLGDVMFSEGVAAPESAVPVPPP